MPDISPAMRDFAREVFAGNAGDHRPCDHCGGVHSRQCPRLKSLKTTYFETQRVDRSQPQIASYEVEFWAPGTWEDDVIFPEEVYEDGDDT